MKQPSLSSPVFSHKSGGKVASGHVPIRKVHVCMSSDRKVACHSQGGETRPNREAIDGCRVRVGSKAYSASNYKHGTCIGFWRDRADNVCLASVNSCIFHVNQLPSSRRPNMAWSGNEFTHPSTRTQTYMHSIL